MKKRLVIIGGGASSIAAALYARSIMEDADITIIEKNDRIGKKLLRTGNGKCNITNDNVSADCYLSPIVSATLKEFDVKKTKDLLAKLGIVLKADQTGRNYPYSESAATLLNALLSELKAKNIEIVCEFDANKITAQNGAYKIEGNKQIFADCIIIAAGSPACVKNYSAYKLLENTGIKFTDFRPALCPLPSDEKFLKSLKGVRAKAKVNLNGRCEEGEVQFNEKNISGICVFNLARYVNESTEVKIDFMPEYSENEITDLLEIKHNKSFEASEICDGLILRKLSLVILKRAGFKPSQNAGELSRNDIKKIANQIKTFTVRVKAPTDFSAAQVCSGGIKNETINPETLELKDKKGIFCCGEILDVDAPCGGYNLQWAISSGLNAAKNAAKYLGE